MSGESTSPIPSGGSRRLPMIGNTDDSVSTAAIYARTSVSKLDSHYSIDEQISECWQLCKAHGWDVAYVFVDEGESGTNTDRAEFQRMLRKAEKGKMDVVVFWTLDRFARSLADLVRTEEKLNEWDVALHSATEFIDTASPVGRFNFRNLASASELESDMTAHRVKIGFHGMAKALRWPNNNPPLGYDLAEDQKLSISDEEAALVRRIFRMYLRERSMPRVAHLLNETGVTTKNGNEWTRWAVKKIISNSLYKGQYQMGEYEEYVEEYQIISERIFETVTETRYRYRDKKGSMDGARKLPKSEKIIERFKASKEV